MSSVPNAVAGLKIPDLELPFTCAGHPQTAEIGEATLTWLRDAGLLASEEQIQRTRVILDDRVAEQQGSRQARLAAVSAQLLRCEQASRFPDRTEPAGAIEDLARDLARRLRTVATPDQLLRMRWHTLQYFLAITAEAARTAEAISPGLATAPGTPSKVGTDHRAPPTSGAVHPLDRIRWPCN